MATGFKQEYLGSFTKETDGILTVKAGNIFPTITNAFKKNTPEEDPKYLGVRWYNPNDKIIGNSLVEEVCKVLQARPIYDWDKKTHKDPAASTIYSCENERFAIGYYDPVEKEKDITYMGVYTPSPFYTSYNGQQYTINSDSSTISKRDEPKAWISGKIELFSDLQKEQLGKFILLQLTYRRLELEKNLIAAQEKVAQELFGKNIRHFSEKENDFKISPKSKIRDEYSINTLGEMSIVGMSGIAYDYQSLFKNAMDSVVSP